MPLENSSASGRHRLIEIERLAQANGPGTEAPDSQAARKALLVCKDATLRGWGPRWLEQAGFSTLIAQTQAELQLCVANLRPSLLLVESGVRTRDGVPMYRWLADSNLADIPMLVLCASDKDVENALDAGAVDVARKPFNWQIISRRSAQLVRSQSSLRELDRAQDALHRALDYAQDARQFLQRVENTDLLTDLPNRKKFAETIERALAADGAGQEGLAVMLIGLDRFRAVNDHLGHEGGNAVLAEVGRRLHGCLSREDLFSQQGNQLRTAAVAKLGGVRFGLLLSHGGDDRDLERMASIVQGVLSQPVEYAGQSVYFGASVGISVATRDGRSAEELLLKAESALLEVKRLHGGVHIFAPSQDQQAVRRLRLEAKLRDALADGSLDLHYQPLHGNTSDNMFGVEALLRWRCPEEGYISPAEFVPVAEDAGLMVEIGDYVIREACRQARRWADQGLPPLRVAVNVAVDQLTRGNLVRCVREALMDQQLDPGLLELELSERGVVKNDPEILRKLQQLKALGVRLSIDDFGSGDASISYLKHLPVDTLKIDRSYVSGEAASERDQVMGMVMTTLGKKLGLTVIAEGVETSEQLARVKAWGCDASQGFYFSPAVTSVEIADMLNKVS